MILRHRKVMLTIATFIGIAVALDSPPIYFTTNGEDPRLFGGDINNVAARVFTEPFAIDESTQIQARAMINGSHFISDEYTC